MQSDDISDMFALFTYGGLLASVPGIGALHIYGLAITSSIAASAAFITHRRRKTKQREKKRDLQSRFSGNAIIRETGLGASGIVMAAAAVATCLRPTIQVVIFPMPMPMPLYVATGLVAAVDAYMIDKGDKIGHDAHLGGFAWGAVYYLLLLRNKGGIWRLLSRR